MKNRDLMSSGNPFKAVLVFSIPSILAMMVNAIYNIADKIFVSKINIYALEGLQVVNPLTFFSFSVMVMFGLGTASYASNKLGEKKDEEANRIFNNGFFFQIILSLLVSILFFIFRNPLLKLAGVTVNNYEYALEYFEVLTFGFVFQSSAYFFTMNIRSEGRPNISMCASITGCIVNIILDYLFVLVFDMGVFGAALATVIGHISNFLVGLYYYILSKKNMFKIEVKNALKFNFNYIYQIATIGISSLILNLCTGTCTIIFNNVIKNYSDGSLATLAILTSIDSLCVLPCVGIRQGLLPLFGYNYGEKNYKRMFKLYLAGMIYGIGYGLFICSMIILFPTFFVKLFISSDDSIEVLNRTVSICKFYQIGIIFISFNMNSSAMYQATREKLKASLLSSMRQCLYLIPLLLIFNNIISNGYSEMLIWWTTPISDLLSALSALILFLITLITFKKTGYLSKKDRLKESIEE